MKAGKTRHDAF